MARPLVIVESPAKAKTISRFLGKDYDVRASVGHVADLPSKGLAVDVDNGFKPTYELTVRGKDVVKDLRAALKDASELYLATDEDVIRQHAKISGFPATKITEVLKMIDPTTATV